MTRRVATASFIYDQNWSKLDTHMCLLIPMTQNEEKLTFRKVFCYAESCIKFLPVFSAFYLETPFVI